METIDQIFGKGTDLTIFQIGARSFAMFFITLVLIRLGGIRMFGKKSVFDDIMVIMLGAILSRGVVGANPFFQTVVASAVMILVHRFLAWICIKNASIEKLIKGTPILLYKDGIIFSENLQKTSLSESDLMESLRLETKLQSLKKIKTATMETSGRISFEMSSETDECL